MSEFAEKIKTISFAGKRAPKVTTDVHDYGTVDTTEHWDDRVDVTVKPDTIELETRVKSKRED